MHRQRLTACAYIVGLLALPAAIASYGDHVAAMPSVTSMAEVFHRNDNMSPAAPVRVERRFTRATAR